MTSPHSKVERWYWCKACGRTVRVRWSDGVPLSSNEVYAMFPLDGSDPLILHHGCEGPADEITPELVHLPLDKA